MTTIAIALLAWLVLSLPLALVLGRALAAASRAAAGAGHAGRSTTWSAIPPSIR
jgi:hypothetical protein